MLVEVKVKVKYIIDGKARKIIETFLTEKEFFAQAEFQVTQLLSEAVENEAADSYEVQSLKISPIKEIATQFHGTHTFIATLKDVWLDNDGNEKHLRYKILLWAEDLSEATSRVRQLAREGYDMQIEGLKEVNYTYLDEDGTEETA